MQYPRITIVTPSYNQGQFLEETILSVIGQQYPNLEYIVMDGGSTDNSVEIIKKYERHLAYWVSERDEGQSAAINKGFGMATGDILAWLNSDDWYLPGALYAAATQFRQNEFDFLHGGCLLRFEDRPEHYWVRMPQMLHQVSTDIRIFDFIDQPSSFWSRRAWKAAGPLDESLKYVFDWDYFIRVSRSFTLHCSEGIFSAYRHHAAHKTGAGGEPRLQEIVEVVRRYADDEWQRAYEECHSQLLPASRQFASRWGWLPKVVGGWRLFEALKKSVPRSLIQRHGAHKVHVASTMLGIY